MQKYKKQIASFTQDELLVESTRLRELLKKAILGKISGRNKNLREIFVLRKHLAIVLTKSSQAQ